MNQIKILKDVLGMTASEVAEFINQSGVDIAPSQIKGRLRSRTSKFDPDDLSLIAQGIHEDRILKEILRQTHDLISTLLSEGGVTTIEDVVYNTDPDSIDDTLDFASLEAQYEIEDSEIDTDYCDFGDEWEEVLDEPEDDWESADWGLSQPTTTVKPKASKSTIDDYLQDIINSSSDEEVSNADLAKLSFDRSAKGVMEWSDSDDRVVKHHVEYDEYGKQI